MSNRVKKIAHVGIATRSIAVTSEFYKSLGLEVDIIEVVEDQKVRVAVMAVGDSAIELIEPTDIDSPVHRSLEARGEGLHHLTFEVEDLAKHLEMLKERNIKLIDEKPRSGAGNRLVAFIHPDSTGGVLVELSQHLSEEAS
ncbi:MAG: methylmalonyl-CoA epimerase [Acidobacteriota bacterium]